MTRSTAGTTSSVCRKARAPRCPQDRIRIAYARDGAVLLDMDSSASGLGDMSLDFGYSLHSHDIAAAVAAWLSIKLPTGRCRPAHRQRSDRCVAGDRRRASTRRKLVAVRPSRRHAARRWRAPSGATARHRVERIRRDRLARVARARAESAAGCAHRRVRRSGCSTFSATRSCSPSAATIASRPAGSSTSR